MSQTGDVEAPCEEWCRICGDAGGELVQVCACTSKVHRACQAQWLETRAEGDIPTLRGELLTCEVCGTQVAVTLPCASTLGVSLEGCALLLLCALAAGAHLVYLGALRRVAVAVPPHHAVPALAARNALATALLLALSARGSAYVLRTRPSTCVVVAVGAAASLLAGAMVLALAAT